MRVQWRSLASLVKGWFVLLGDRGNAHLVSSPDIKSSRIFRQADGSFGQRVLNDGDCPTFNRHPGCAVQSRGGRVPSFMEFIYDAGLIKTQLKFGTSFSFDRDKVAICT